MALVALAVAAPLSVGSSGSAAAPVPRAVTIQQPVRVMDTRVGTGASRQQLVPGTPTVLQLPDAVAAGATSVVLNLTAVNGLFEVNGQSTASFGPNDRPVNVTVANTPGESLFITYTVTCTGNGTNRDSGASPQGQATIQEPATDDGGDGGDAGGEDDGSNG